MDEKEKKAHDEAKENSKSGGIWHVNKTIAGDYYVSEWFCDSHTLAIYENGKKL